MTTDQQPAEELELREMHHADHHRSPSASSQSSVHEPLLLPPPSTRTSIIPTRTEPSLTIYALTLSAGLSGLLFGYDTGVISSTLVSIRDDLSSRPLTTTDKSLITAVTSLFALLFAPLTGWAADKYGRRAVIAVASVLFALGSGVQAQAGAVWVMVLGRAGVGAAVGLASCATPLYITELAPADLRGRLVTIQSLFITGGQVVAYLAGWGLADREGGWRWMVGLGAGPAVLQLGLLGLMYESPRWLVQAGSEKKAREVLRKVYGAMADEERDAVVEAVTRDIETELAASANSTDESFAATAKALIHDPPNRRALTIACMLQAAQQACGFNSLMYFSATIFLLSGFTSPIGTSLSVALTNFAFTLVAFAYIDTVGRRKILLRSIPFMVLGLLAASLAFAFMDVAVAPGGEEEPAKTTGLDDGRPASAWSVVLLGSLILYVAAYAIGLGCVPWQQSELFPLRVRSLGSGLATATNWSANFVIGVTFLPLMQFFGASATFLIYAAVCVFGWSCIWRIYPETAGLELEGIGELLKEGWGVRDSVLGFEARRKDVSGERLDAG